MNASQPSLRSTMLDIYHETTAFKTPAPFPSHLSGSSTRTLRSHALQRFPILSFYRGYLVTLLGRVPYGGTAFLVWGSLQSTFLPPLEVEQANQHRNQHRAAPVTNLVIGAISGVCAQTAAYPFDIVRRRMQVGGLLDPDPQTLPTLSDTVKRVWTERGWRGFYVGLSIGYVKIVPMTAISFAVWQWGKDLLSI